MPQDVASPAGEQAKVKHEFTSCADDACDSLCRIGHATKRHTISSKGAECKEDKVFCGAEFIWT